MHVLCLANAILSGNGVYFYLYDNCFGPDFVRGYFLNVCKINCSMIPKWHHAVSRSVYPKVPETTTTKNVALLMAMHSAHETIVIKL